jgi:hypothetical protein
MITSKAKVNAVTGALAEAGVLHDVNYELDANGDPCWRVKPRPGADLGAVHEAASAQGMNVRFDGAIQLEDPDAVAAAEKKSEQLRAEREAAAEASLEATPA